MGTRQILLGKNVILVLFVIFYTVRSESSVALNKAAKQSSDQGSGIYVASKVVDGCTDTNLDNKCCAHTASGHKMVWWRVDLGELTTITWIKIYYRDDFQHTLAGYQLYVSNTTNTLKDGDLCYEDTSSTRDAVQLVVTHQCPYVGRYVTVYNYRNNQKRYSWYSDDAILMLCEVQVFGCQVGRYGDGHCNNQCPGACYGGNCNTTTGDCFYCVAGKYGISCNSDCPANCKDSFCTKDTGSCLDCFPGKYGPNCDQNCPDNCKDMLCERDTGSCKECKPGFFEANCSKHCHCKDAGCNYMTGNCSPSGCLPGWRGNTCSESCGTGSFGETCSLACPVTCKDFVCHHETGHCQDCYPGKYGVVCGADCPDTCTDNICRKDDGQCLSTESPNTSESSDDSKMTIIVVLAVICGLLVAALIASAVVICHLRKRQNRKKSSDKGTEQSVPDTGYTSITHRPEETPHVYEMVVT
ncbi:multiple epidermal growth factor-like domains protein 10 [Pecten maximus]|uniref:multiple epidermal growth factor-like domains protein 10 n=1 Tax=Pecten maximus TaxID=6579 RepID=UPI001458CFC8|nr:multiple epidermal growth factor-like domains protein 10 [Pecten maximus]